MPPRPHVLFQEVIFRNTSPLTVDVSVETPRGGSLLPAQTIPGGGYVQIPVGKYDCQYVAIWADAPGQPRQLQVFEISEPELGSQRAYLTNVAVEYNVGSLEGWFEATTEPRPS